MLNVLQEKKVSKQEVIDKLTNLINIMNEHQFRKLVKQLNKRGVFN